MTAEPIERPYSDSETVFGVEIQNLPPGWHGQEVVVLVKAYNDDPSVSTTFNEFWSPGLTKPEALGMAITFADSLRDLLRDPHAGNPHAHDDLF